MDGVRAFPQSIEAERALLGGLMQRPDLLIDVADVLHADDFYRHDHGALFDLLRDMQSRGDPIDMITVPERVGRSGHDEKYGGVAYVVELPEHAPSTANLTHYAQTVRSKSLLRKLIATCQDLANAAYAQPDDVVSLLDRAGTAITSLGASHQRGDWTSLSLAIDDELMAAEKRSGQKSGITGVPSGFIDLDEKLAGLQRGDLIILGARPSMGKTALALNIAQYAALIGKETVAVFSMEMRASQLAARLLCSYALIDANELRTGNLDTPTWDRLLEASDVLRGAPIEINDRPNLTLAEIRAYARRLKAKKGNLGLIVVDYLQLMGHEDQRASRVQQLSDFSRGLKGLAKDLDVPVVALSQLSRNVESRQDKRPMMSDLRESGAIEQDADVVMFIYRDEYYNKDSVDQGVAEVIIAKQRNGATGTIRLAFQGRFTRFDNLGDGDAYS